jgi:hypothetical protein
MRGTSLKRRLVFSHIGAVMRRGDVAHTQSFLGGLLSIRQGEGNALICITWGDSGNVLIRPIVFQLIFAASLSRFLNGRCTSLGRLKRLDKTTRWRPGLWGCRLRATGGTPWDLDKHKHTRMSTCVLSALLPCPVLGSCKLDISGGLQGERQVQ